MKNILFNPHKVEVMFNKVGITNIIQLQNYLHKMLNIPFFILHPQTMTLSYRWMYDRVKFCTEQINNMSNDEHKTLISKFKHSIMFLKHPSKELIQLHNMVWKI